MEKKCPLSTKDKLFVLDNTLQVLSGTEIHR